VVLRFAAHQPHNTTEVPALIEKARTDLAYLLVSRLDCSIADHAYYADKCAAAEWRAAAEQRERRAAAEHAAAERWAAAARAMVAEEEAAADEAAARKASAHQDALRRRQQAAEPRSSGFPSSSPAVPALQEEDDGEAAAAGRGSEDGGVSSPRIDASSEEEEEVHAVVVPADVAACTGMSVAQMHQKLSLLAGEVAALLAEISESGDLSRLDQLERKQGSLTALENLLKQRVVDSEILASNYSAVVLGRLLVCQPELAALPRALQLRVAAHDSLRLNLLRQVTSRVAAVREGALPPPPPRRTHSTAAPPLPFPNNNDIALRRTKIK